MMDIFSLIGSFARCFPRGKLCHGSMYNCWWFDACWWNPSDILLLGRLSELHSWPDVSGYNGQTCERFSLFYSTILVCRVIVLQLKSFTSFKVCLWLPTSNDKMWIGMNLPFLRVWMTTEDLYVSFSLFLFCSPMSRCQVPDVIMLPGTAMCNCTGITDESTEPDPGTISGC